MQTASRSRDRGLSSANVPGNNSRSANSTRDSSHVTEAIGNLYVGESDQESDSNRNRNTGSYHRHEGWSQIKDAGGHVSKQARNAEPPATGSNNHLSPSSESTSRSSKGSPRGGSGTIDTSGSSIQSASPSVLQTPNDQFPLDDIEYESNPAAVAKELSNLQALRRMSMDASPTSDPDLPSYNWMATTPPTAADDEQDARRLFWVPARLHPELAPREWKTFVESRVKEIRANGGKEAFLSANQPSLRRKKSMLSRQIDTTGKAADQYEDGADRLEKRRSAVGGPPVLKVSDLENLANDPSSLLRKLSISQQGRGEGENGKENDDDLILPPAPPGHMLKRSTRTYRRGGGGGIVALRERGKRISEGTKSDVEDFSGSLGPPVPELRLQRVRTEPISSTLPLAEQPGSSRSRPENSIEKSTKAVKSKPTQSAPVMPSPSSSFEDMLANSASIPPSHASAKHSSGRSRASTSSSARRQSQDKIPRIIETPPEGAQQFLPPERTSSHQPPAQSQQTAGKGTQRPQLAGQGPSVDAKDSQWAGGQTSARTDSLSVSSGFDKDDKRDRGGAKRSDSAASGRKSSWGWLLGDSDKEKEKEREKEKEKERETKSRKKISKSDRSSDRDHARLDVLQKSIEGDKGKEGREPSQSPEKERDSGRDRANEKEKSSKDKDGGRKSNSEDKKEKDGLFSSFFGGSRKKSTGEPSTKSKSAARTASPDRHAQPQQAFYYTRFPIHIERAIYRLSHLKLANPRRPLLQQVLLSNFMYSYLAKVQMTQPHLLQQAAIQQQQMQQQQQQAAYEQQMQQQQQQQQYEQQQAQYHQEHSEQYYPYDDGPSQNGMGYSEELQHQYQQQQQQMYECEEIDPHSQPPQSQQPQQQFYQPRSTSRKAQYNSHYGQQEEPGNYHGEHEAQRQGPSAQAGSQRGYR